jgi:hypothetical protein
MFVVFSGMSPAVECDVSERAFACFSEGDKLFVDNRACFPEGDKFPRRGQVVWGVCGISDSVDVELLR